MARKSKEDVIKQLTAAGVQLTGEETYPELLALVEENASEDETDPKPVVESKKASVQEEMDSITKNIALIEAGNNGHVKVRRPQVGSDAMNQLAYFAKQPKVRYRLTRSADEPKGAYETHTVNDLMITIGRGVNVNLPEDVAKNLDDSQSIPDEKRQEAALKDIPSQLQR